MYHRNSFTKRIPPLIRFIEEHPAKYNTSSKQYLEGKTIILKSQLELYRC